MVSEVRVRQREVSARGKRYILVANSKGGSGKSTVATNLAAGYAQLGYQTSLVDIDPQLSSARWLSARSPDYPHITGIIGTSHATNQQLDWVLRVPPDAERIIIDSRGSMVGQKLYNYIDRVDDIVVPILPSSIDMESTEDYLNDIYSYAGFRESNKRILLVGNRLNKRNKYYHKLGRFLKRMSKQELILLPDSYIFLRCSDEGLGVADLRAYARYKQAIAGMAKLIHTIEESDATAQSKHGA